MLLRLENAAAAMSEMRRHQEQVANNLANADTTGYKKAKIFTEALNERIDANGAPRSTRQIQQANDLSEGAIEETGNPLDVALGGDGFFVTQPEGGGAERYTRAGHFVVGSEGTLRTVDGAQVMGEGGPINIPVDDGGRINISEGGQITLDGDQVGALRVVDFDDAVQLQHAEGASFVAQGAQPNPMDDPTVLQGKVETSNVDPVSEMTNMIEYFRQFEAQQKVLSTTDSTLGRALQTLGSF